MLAIKIFDYRCKPLMKIQKKKNENTSFTIYPNTTRALENLIMHVHFRRPTFTYLTFYKKKSFKADRCINLTSRKL